MAEIDPVILELRAELSRYNNQLRATTTIVDRSLQQQERRVISLERQFERSSGAISSRLRLLAGTFAGAFSAREVGGLIDGFTRLQNSLRVAGLEGDALASVQERLRQIGATYGVEIEALGAVFNRATLAQKELGASQEEIIRLNEVIAASLKVTGASTQQASGALLQLAQALGSDIVRGEEFNSILEGALPIAQAAARGIERFGGSVAKLRAEVVEGNVTSKEFFEGILRGGVETIKQAETATLTLGGAFTVLRNELTLYVGEAARSNGLTAALAIGIQSLAENLDRFANALAIVSAVLIGRFAAGAMAGGRGLHVLSAYASVATTSLAGTALAARAAGTALLAAFGGPVGVAITAVVLALGYAVTRSNEFERAQEAQAKGVARATDATEGARDALERLATATGAARKEAIAFAEAKRQETRDLLKNAAAALLEAQAKGRAARAAALSAPNATPIFTGPGGSGTLARQQTANAAVSKADRDIAEAAGEFKTLVSTFQQLSNAINGAAPTTAPGVPGKPDKTKKGRTTPVQRMASQAEFDEELRRLAAEELQDRLALTSDIEKRAELQEGILSLERQSRVAAIQNDEALTDERKRQLIALTNLRYGLDEQGNIVTNSNKAALVGKELIDRENDLRNAALRDEIRTAEASADLLTNRGERLAAEKRILALIEQEERNALERAIADGQVLDAARARSNLAQQQASRQAGTDRQFESPLQRYRREVEEGTSNIGDAYEEIAIDGVRTLNSELANTVKNVLGLNGALGNTVAKLIEIALQKGAFDLLGSLFGGGKASASDTAVSSALSIASQFIPGRASGGYAGSLVRVNEGASPGRVEGFMPNGGGQIIPLGRMNAMSPQQAGGGTSTIRLELSGDIDARMKSVAAGVSIEVVRTAAPMIREQAAKDVASMNRPRI